MASKFVIMVNRATADKLNAVHEAIKTASAFGGWWHHVDNVWIVTGKSASDWRDIAKRALAPLGKSGVLVLKVSEVSGGRWAGAGVTGVDWLKDAFPGFQPSVYSFPGLDPVVVEAAANWLRTYPDVHNYPLAAFGEQVGLPRGEEKAALLAAASVVGVALTFNGAGGLERFTVSAK